MREFLRFWRHFVNMLGLVSGIVLVLAGGLAVCAFFIHRAEDMAFGEALYFTMITGLTVGYGDITPASPVARVLSIIAALIGVVFVGIVVAVATRALTLTAEEEKEVRREKK